MKRGFVYHISYVPNAVYNDEKSYIGNVLKYKPYILKYKALILKYVPCIFALFKCRKIREL